MLTREQIYGDITDAKDILAYMQEEYTISPKRMVTDLFESNLPIREKIAILTVLYTGRWQKTFYGSAFVMPATRDCIEQYPNVKKNFGKEVTLQTEHYAPDEKEWEGFIYLSFQNFKKKTA